MEITIRAIERADAVAYVKLFRFPYHLSFIGVVLGVLVTARGAAGAYAADVLRLYLSFNVLFYGGLYTINALSDAPLDRLHPGKRERPVASGAIDTRTAATFAALLLTAGLVTELAWFGPKLLPAFLLVGLLNLTYSGGLRNVPIADIALNSATHPPRLWLGVTLAGGTCRWEWLALVFLFAVGIAALRRTIELADAGPASRPVLRRYTPVRLLAIRVAAFAAVLALWYAMRPAMWAPYALTTVAFVVFVFVAEAASRSREAFTRLWAS
jgi:4-hydroxybenzoate polyprenyltransferase